MEPLLVRAVRCAFTVPGAAPSTVRMAPCSSITRKIRRRAALWELFERMAESAEHRIDLDRAAKYDHLGLVKALNLLWSAMDRKRLVGLDQYLPTLDRIAKNETYMHTARARAAELAEAIRAGTLAPEPRQ